MKNQDQKPEKTIRKAARALLREGQSRQAAYEALRKEYPPREVAGVLDYLPSAAARQKYGPYNNLLLAILMLNLGFILWQGWDQWSFSLYASSVVQLLMINAVARRLTRYYTWVSVLSGVNLLTLGALVMNSLQTLNGLFWAMAALNLVLLIMPLWVGPKLTPPVQEVKETYTSKSGRSKKRPAFHFPD
ncbi:MAG: hypothetical protein RI565_09210 [Schleiferiaceae bacterium]|nr:hypothetical protein [Schleiferiaceae bacterium]